MEAAQQRGMPEPSGTVTERLLSAGQRLAQIGSWELDLSSGETQWTEGMNRILGLQSVAVARSEEMILEVVHPNDRERVGALLATVRNRPGAVPDEGLTFEFRIVRPDGATRYLRAHGRVERDEGGRPVRWAGVAQDVTEQRLTERELLARYAVTQALREWETFEEGVTGLLRRVGTALDYPMASLWVWDDRLDALACRAFWSAPDVDPQGFEAAKRSLTFRSGEGTPGQAWQQQRLIITPDVAADPTFQPRLAAIERGVRSALHFPALGPDGPVAVLSFYSFERRAVSMSLVRTLTGIGSELGRFLSRRRAELGPRPLSERELEVLGLAAEGDSGPQIAERLLISPGTVKTHFQHIYEKLGVSDRAAAVAQALRTGLIR